MRHNFHEHLEALKRDPKHILPSDINKHVSDFLEKIGCDVGADELNEFQKFTQYGRMEIFNDNVPNSKITIQFDGGMANGREDYKQIIKGSWKIFTYKTIRNANLDKTRPKTKEGKHGS